MGCLENDGVDKVNEQHGADEERTMGAQEQEHESSLDKGDKTAARELKECLLEIQRQIDPSTRHVQDSSTDQYVCQVLYSTIKNAMLIHLGPNQVSK